MSSPYENRPKTSFWKTGLAEQTIESMSGLYKPKFIIGRQTRVATAGSCFAQHIARNMLARGYCIVDTEPPPPGLFGIEAQKYGFCLFSARFGNIYVVRQLLQLFDEALGRWTPKQAVWEKNGRFFDAMRPSVEPGGLASAPQVLNHRTKHLAAVRRMFCESDILIFTLGLTEAWEHRTSGTIYATAPGTVAGSYESGEHQFRNFSSAEIYRDFVDFRERVHQVNPKMKFLLTVSPVPLTATASDQHVLVATTYSKAVLRAVAGQLKAEFEDVDYFPSYEIITNPLARGSFYSANYRSIAQAGVDAVMRVFFGAQENDKGYQEVINPAALVRLPAAEDDVFCDDVLLEVFGE